MSYGAVLVNYLYAQSNNDFLNICIGMQSLFIQTAMKYMYYKLHCNSI